MHSKCTLDQDRRTYDPTCLGLAWLTCCLLCYVSDAWPFTKACHHVCSLAGHKPWDGRSPHTLAGAVLYIICNLFLAAKKSDVKVPLSHICGIVGVGASTIKATVTQLQPDFDDLLPKWVGATQQQVATMIADGYPGSAEPAAAS